MTRKQMYSSIKASFISCLFSSVNKSVQTLQMQHTSILKFVFFNTIKLNECELTKNIFAK